MKKLIIPLLLVFIFFILLKIFPDKTTTTYSQIENNYLKYNFYHKEKEERYKIYQEKNPTLSDIDIITRVNLNLDLPFYTNTKEAPYQNTPLVFVNKYHYLKENYVPNNLEIVEKCVSGSRYLVKDAKEAFETLCEDIQKQNLNIRLISSYRSYSYQETLYNNYVTQDGKEKADTYSARAGFSEHQTGLVIDIDNAKTNYENFENTEEFKWMQENAYKYGFILRYPKGKENITGYVYESWHYRYVGESVATYLKSSNLTLDEYIARKTK